MPFNSNTYHANKNRKRAWEMLQFARYHRDAAVEADTEFLKGFHERMKAQQARAAKGYMLAHVLYAQLCEMDRQAKDPEIMLDLYGAGR